MAEYFYEEIGGCTYSVPMGQKPRKKKPPLVIVMNTNCTCCAGSPVCQTECPVDCIHIVYDDGRPARVYVDNDICIGCMNCFSYEYRPKDVNKGDVTENCGRLNKMDLMTKKGPCPWDAIEVHPFEPGAARSHEFYDQPKEVLPPEKIARTSAEPAAKK